ncbi:lysoplasmalogenase [Streptomyces sp. NPDC058372]|uniref:lysoplasmalogenase n=1 Tax=Streptomyces sp. NPDC058372 TaxID=3346464 RepID=UPI0036659AA9
MAARVLLAAFGLVVAVDLGSLLAGYPEIHLAVKPLLLSVLAAHVAVRGGPPLLIAAAVFGWGGDTLLRFEDDTAFLLGMGSFAVGHLCYLALFARYGSTPRRVIPLGAAYAAALVLLVVLLWPDLPAGLRLPVAAYSLLLTAMAFRSLRLGAATAAGGLLFLLSDALIAMDIAAWNTPVPHDFWVMSTYLAAQYLLVRGVLGAAGTPGSEAAPDRLRPAVGA